ncbi:hypothetical protein GIB67_021854 [Kingdonia uniflora]|uniref:Uncharacterized protein n=1 Tax=Kingdonia uniflora TaxID=39325 RepID=A0A7J7P7E2_9MAGN|nr:hypothetical protein GIB67_021854 [Kingdonia uniflora]
MEEFANRRAIKDYGYHLAVTTLMKIGEAKERDEGDVMFQVKPVEIVFLATKTMPDYDYVHGENPIFHEQGAFEGREGCEGSVHGDGNPMG